MFNKKNVLTIMNMECPDCKGSIATGSERYCIKCGLVIDEGIDGIEKT